MSEGKLKVEPLITDVVPIDQAANTCEKLIQTPNEALGVVFTMPYPRVKNGLTTGIQCTIFYYRKVGDPRFSEKSRSS